MVGQMYAKCKRIGKDTIKNYNNRQANDSIVSGLDIQVPLMSYSRQKIGGEFYDYVDCKLKPLSDKQKVVIELREQKLTYKEIAKRLGISWSSAYALMDRANSRINHNNFLTHTVGKKLKEKLKGEKK